VGFLAHAEAVGGYRSAWAGQTVAEA
jgi:hypothetical protein